MSCARSLPAKALLLSRKLPRFQELDLHTVIRDAHAARRHKEAFERPAAQSSSSRRVAVKSQSGKALLRKRGMHLERTFEHLLDEGGLAERPCREQKIFTKRCKITTACFHHLETVLRPFLSSRTPNQWIAGAHGFFEDLILSSRASFPPLFPPCARRDACIPVFTIPLERDARPRA